MDWLNYHHLRYFWVVAKHGGLMPAGKVLRLSHPTLSAQIHTLEAQLGAKLFMKVGRKLVLTELGRVVFRYAEEIFSLGRDMFDTVKGRSTGKPRRLDVGIADAVPKLVVRRILQPALELSEPVHLVCHENQYERLLADLALHTLDIVIADTPVPPGSSVRAYSHLLGETGVSIFGTKTLVAKYKRGYPASLDGAPMFLPLDQLTLRRALNAWFVRRRVVPRVIGEFEDSALMIEFGAGGQGLVAAPTIATTELSRRYQLHRLGIVESVRERFYAISTERKLAHPAVLAVRDAARSELFGPA